MNPAPMTDEGRKALALSFAIGMGAATVPTPDDVCLAGNPARAGRCGEVGCVCDPHELENVSAGVACE